jgi:hypothetical protein
MDTSKTDETFPTVVADTTGLPYRLRTRGLALLTAILACVGSIGGDLYLAFLLIHNAGHGQAPFVLIVALCGLAIGAFWSYGLYLNLVPNLILLPDRLEQRGLKGWRTLIRSDIKGVRSSGKGEQTALEIVPADGKGSAVPLQRNLRKDPIVERWLQGAPKLEAQADDTAAVLADPRFGATPEERQEMLDRAKGFSVGFFFACLVGSLSFIFVADHRRTELVVAIAALVIGALWLLRSEGFLWLVARRTRQSVIGLLCPAMVLGLTATEDIHLIGGMTLVWIAGGIALAFLVALAARYSAWWFLALPLVPAGGFLIYGLAATADVAFAPPEVRAFPLLVNDMYESGKKNTTYHLQVAAWDDQPAGPVSASVDYYYKVRVGSLVCIFRHKGALGIDWYDVNNCPLGVSAPPAVLALFASLPHKAPPPAAPPKQQAQSGPVYDYPERAQRAGKEGRAVVRCEVANSSLVDCRVQSEDPPGYGFGNAAVGRIMGTDGGPGLQINPEALKGRTEVDIPINFKLRN